LANWFWFVRKTYRHDEADSEVATIVIVTTQGVGEFDALFTAKFVLRCCRIKFDARLHQTVPRNHIKFPLKLHQICSKLVIFAPPYNRHKMGLGLGLGLGLGY
jgi:hypothetical protein